MDNAICVQCPHCAFSGHPKGHTVLRLGKKILTLRCHGCGDRFNIKIRHPKKHRR